MVDMKMFSSVYFATGIFVFYSSKLCYCYQYNEPLIMCDYAVAGEFPRVMPDSVSANLTVEPLSEDTCDGSCTKDRDILVYANDKDLQLFWNVSKHIQYRQFRVRFCVTEQSVHPYSYKSQYWIVTPNTDKDVKLGIHCKYSGDEVDLQATIYNGNNIYSQLQCYGSTPDFPMSGYGQESTHDRHLHMSDTSLPQRLKTTFADSVRTMHQPTTGESTSEGKDDDDTGMNTTAILAVVCGSLAGVLIAGLVLTFVYRKGRTPPSNYSPHAGSSYAEMTDVVLQSSINNNLTSENLGHSDSHQTDTQGKGDHRQVDIAVRHHASPLHHEEAIGGSPASRDRREINHGTISCETDFSAQPLQDEDSGAFSFSRKETGSLIHLNTHGQTSVTEHRAGCRQSRHLETDSFSNIRQAERIFCQDFNERIARTRCNWQDSLTDTIPSTGSSFDPAVETGEQGSTNTFNNLHSFSRWAMQYNKD